MTASCATCRFWRHTVPDCADPSDPLPETPLIGDCRRYPPPDGHDDFPSTSRGTWCGEYEPAGRLMAPTPFRDTPIQGR